MFVDTLVRTYTCVYMMTNIRRIFNFVVCCYTRNPRKLVYHEY